ncbi:MRC2 protein, partial [Amia calva]|nr:MRC2 protein [Amia calva]
MPAGLSGEENKKSRYLTFVQKEASWNEAQSYCRKTYTDLVTVYSQEDNNNLARLASHSNSSAWIGLHHRAWQWSNEEPVRFNTLGEVDSSDPASCVLISPNGMWGKADCLEEHQFICYTETTDVTRIYILIEEKQSWTAAQRYCQEKYRGLVSVVSSTANGEIRQKLKGEAAWIGLYFEPWLWADEGRSSFQNWATGQPNNTAGKCVAMKRGVAENGTWNVDNCNKKNNFFCFKG